MSNAIIPGSLSAIAQNENKSLAESFLNAEIVVLVDNSGSMGVNDAPGGLSRRQAAKNELRHIQGQHPGKIALICFATFPIFSPGGDILACGDTTAMAKALKFVKVADDCGLKIVLITDGAPDSPHETLKVAGQFKSKIDAIYIGKEGGYGFDFLQQLMTVTGGKTMQSAEPGLLANNVEILLLGA